MISSILCNPKPSPYITPHLGFNSIKLLEFMVQIPIILLIPMVFSVKVQIQVILKVLILKEMLLL